MEFFFFIDEGIKEFNRLWNICFRDYFLGKSVVRIFLKMEGCD